MFRQTGFTAPRVIEAIVTAAVFVFASFLLDGVIPQYLADRMCKPGVGEGANVGDSDFKVTRIHHNPESSNLSDSLPAFPGFAWWVPYPLDQESRWFRAEELLVSKLKENRDEIWCALIPVQVDPNLIDHVDAVAIAEWDLVWSPHIDLHWVPAGLETMDEPRPNHWSDKVWLVPSNLLAEGSKFFVESPKQAQER